LRDRLPVRLAEPIMIGRASPALAHIFYSRDGTCRQPYVKGLTLMVNSIFNGWRMEDVWLDK
jgi:hypothetical protein